VKLANGTVEGQPRVLVEREGRAAVLPPVLGGVSCTSTDDVIRAWSPDLRDAIRTAAPEAELAVDAVRFRPAVVSPRKILCVGHNYRRHVEEMGQKMPEVPQLFSKFQNALAAHREAIPLPPETRAVDYEAELAVVIGQGGRRVPEAEALSRVFGYTGSNDVSARDLQYQTSQWLLGKSLDRFCPLGPWIALADEVKNPQALDIRLTLNGEERQHSTTADMIFSVAHIIHYASRYWTLEPGDVILTGTPSGVINGKPAGEREWLKPGDVTRVEIEGIGVLESRFSAE
jgi:2-keto-4-pentenoate hydratase/2-oxohepta-3-ene-1,7-dioic acid hydratase in catechol pathway